MNIQHAGEACRAYIVVVHLAISLIAFFHAINFAVGGAGLAPCLPASKIWRFQLGLFYLSDSNQMRRSWSMFEIDGNFKSTIPVERVIPGINIYRRPSWNAKARFGAFIRC